MKPIALAFALLATSLFLQGAEPAPATPSIAELTASAEKGDPEAQYDLAVRYYHGFYGASHDFAAALKWFQKAAEQGHASAQNRLALMYENGEGTIKDLSAALKWLQKAAAQGSDTAQYNLALMYYEGKGTTKDLSAAFKWRQKAADQGNPLAQYKLAFMYYKGEGTTKDLSAAFKWFQKVAEQGIPEAQFNLGIMYEKGEGTSKDLSAAFKWYQKAAEQGDADAQFNLALMYRNGEGVIKDEMEALAWFYMAKKTGFDETETSSVSRAISLLEEKLGPRVALSAQQRARELDKIIESNVSDPFGGFDFNAASRSLDEIITSKKSSSPPSQSASTPNPTPQASGSGSLISSDGLILTAAHVVANANSIQVVTDKGTFPAAVLQIDKANDIALLRCAGTFPALPIVGSRNIRVGQTIFTIGFPQIRIQGFNPKFTKGEISSQTGMKDDPRHWQISVPVQPGNSGGPLLNEKGEIIGVIVAKLDAIATAELTGDLPQNVNYAVKSAYIQPLLGDYDIKPSAPIKQSARMEDIVEQVQKSIVMVLVY